MVNLAIDILNKAGGSFCQYASTMLIQSSVLILLLFAIDLLVRKRVRAVFRYCIWMLVFVKLVLPPSLSLPTGIGYWCGDYLPAESAILEEASNLPVTESTTTAMSQDFAVVAAELPQVRPSGPAPEAVAPDLAAPAVSGVSNLLTISWQGVAFLTWLVGVLVLCVLLIQRMWFVKGLIAQSAPAQGRLLDTLNQCRRQIGIRGNVELRLSKNMLSPAACGLARPIILMPASLLEKLSREKLRAVLIHELAHIKRGDLWVNFAQTILQIIYFYNPFVWLANAIVRRIREQAVDEMVLTKLGDEAKNYSNTLIDIAEIAFARPMLSLRLIGVVESKKTLKARVKHILNRPIPKTAKLGLAGLLCIVILGCALLPMAKATPGPPEFIIKGTVTDAETGQPIAGAKVGDVDRYAEGKQWTTTDANGNYSYKTWYEEHGIKAEATGYKMETTGLFTELFGSEKEKVIDFALTPEKASDSSEFKATLPNGVTVELVGVCEHPSEDKQWWRPDGSLLKEPLYKTTGSKLPPHESYKYYEFAAGLQDQSGTSIKWDVPGGRQSSYTGSPLDKDGRRVDALKVYTVNYPIGRETALVQIGLAAGVWKTLASHTTEKKEATYSFEDGAAAFGQAYEKDGQVLLPFVHNLQHKRKVEASRIVAVTNSGQEIGGGVSGSGGNVLDSSTYQFHIPLKEIKEFQFQTRPYEWIEFKNVSLKPGVKTEVQVETVKDEKKKSTNKSQNEIRREKITEVHSNPKIIHKAAYDLFEKIKNADYDYFLSVDWEQFPIVEYYNSYRDYPELVRWICKTFKENPIVSIELGDVSFSEGWPRIYYKLILKSGAILEGDLHFEYHFYHGDEGRWHGIHGHFYDGPETSYKVHGLDWHLQENPIKTAVQVEGKEKAKVVKVKETTVVESTVDNKREEIFAKLLVLQRQRERVQKELDFAEEELKKLRQATFSDLEERSYPHPVTARLSRLQLERDNCILEISQQRAKIENLEKLATDKEALKSAKANLIVLQHKLEDLERMVEEAKAEQRDLDRARAFYKQRVSTRDEIRQRLNQLKGQINTLEITYAEAEHSIRKQKPKTAKALKIIVYEGGKSEPEVTLNIPLTGLKIANNLLPPKAKEQMAAQGIDLAEILEQLGNGLEPTTLLDVKDGQEHIIISLE